MQELEKLNSYQLEAVLDEHPACIVNANVGSGKTTVLIQKILYLNREKQIPFSDMVVLTFTNKAADEIRSRLPIQMETLYFGTFHSIAMRFLQTRLPIEELHYTKDFQVCLPEEEVEMAQDLIARWNYKIKYKNRLKKRLELAEKGINDKYEDDLEELVRQLKIEKQSQDKMTYEDLLKNASKLLQEHPEIKRPAWLIVDEVQDCDAAQLEFLDALKGTDTQLFAVGDPNQVIYGWRGSTFGIFYQLKQKYGAVEYALPINYRSSKFILKAAERFQQNGNKLEGTQDTGEKVQVTGHHDAFTEADYLAGRIKELHDIGIPYDEIGILYRLQNQSEILGKVLERNQIPYTTSLKMSWFDIPVINWLYYLCRFMVNENDNAALLKIITDHQYGDQLTEKKARKLLDEEQYEKIPFIKQLWGHTLSDFYTYSLEDWINELKKRVSISERIGITTERGREDAKLVNDFFDKLIAFGNDKTQNTIEIVKDFLNEASLYGLSFQEDCDVQKKDAVRLMTIHASKGLEFHQVFIIGVNNGLIPLRGTNEEEREEEQRLLFVGMTRAKHGLELSYYTSAVETGIYPGPSIYLKMIRSDLIETPLSEGKNQKEMAEHLQKMKRLIQENKASQAEKKKEETRIRIRHAKYGEGWIIREDGDNIIFDFDDFGEKAMLKMFTKYDKIDIVSM